MLYPAKYSSINNDPIQIDDIVWSDEGTQVGFIYDVIDSLAEAENWGVEETGIMIQTLHPLEAREQECSPGLFFCAEGQLEDEGIGKLSQNELNEMSYAVSIMIEKLQTAEIIYTISAHIDIESGNEFWHIGTLTNPVILDKLPFRTGTRHMWP